MFFKLNYTYLHGKSVPFKRTNKKREQNSNYAPFLQFKHITTLGMMEDETVWNV